MTRQDGHEFSAEETAELLAELDVRLRHRGVAASIFVVGGAAIAATGVRSGRLTEDVDALTRDTVVLDEAKSLARERGLPKTWLNPNANMWMPPLPQRRARSASRARTSGHLRRRRLPARHQTHRPTCQGRGRCHCSRRTTWTRDRNPRTARGPIRTYYTDEAAQEFVVDGRDVDQEITFLAQDASRMLNRTAAEHSAETLSTDPDPGADCDRLHRSRQQEERSHPRWRANHRTLSLPGGDEIATA